MATTTHEAGTDAASIADVRDAGLTPATDALIRRLHSRLDHELRDERPRFSSWEAEAADAAGQPARGPL